MIARRPARLAGVVLACTWPACAVAQVRPLVTEDPQPITPGDALFDIGVDYARRVVFPASGLTGNETRVAIMGLRVGLSPIVEVAAAGGPRDYLSVTKRQPAPLAGVMTFTGDRTHAVDDLVLAAKVRVVGETDRRPAVGVRVAVRLPNANGRSGLGLNTTDVLGGVLVGKSAGALRLLGNLGVGILGEPTNAMAQNDVLTYGAAMIVGRRPLQGVAEVNGRVATRHRGVAVGTESRGMARAGIRWRRARASWDLAIGRGMTDLDPTIAVAVGFSYQFHVFTPPVQ